MPDIQGKARILICEDEVIIAADLESRLRKLGYTITGKTTRAERALDLLEQNQPDLVIMDIVFEGVTDGIDVAEIIRDKWGIPVVFLTAYADSDRLERAKLTYPFGYLLKPFRERDLKITVEMALYTAKVDAERRKAEKALSRSQMMLARTEEIANVGSWEWDIKEDRVIWSDELFRIFKLDPSNGAPSWAEHNSLQLYHPDDLAILGQAANLAVEEGTPYELELRAQRRDGETRICLAKGFAEFGSDGNVERLFGSLQDITERKRAEEELRLTLDATTDGIWSWIFKSNKFEFSSQYYTMLGYEPGEFPASYESWVSLIHPDDLNNALEVALEYLETKPDYYENEFRLKTKTGDYLWVSAKARVVERDSDGLAIRIIGNHQDISDRKLMEEALKDKAGFEKILMNSIPAPVFYKDVKGRYLGVNKEFETFFGKKEHEIIGKSVFDINPPELANIYHSKDAEVFFTGELQQYESQVQNQDGVLKDVIFHKAPFHDEQGKIQGLIGVILDITDRKRAEEKLKESRARIETAFSSMSDAVYITDLDGNLVEFNEAFATFHKFKSKAECSITLAERHNIIDVYFPDGTIAPLKQWAVPRALRGETVIDAEYSLRRKDTGETWIGSYNFSPIYGEDGKIIGSVVIARDITDRKRTEERIKSSLREKETLLKELNHRVKNNMQVIISLIRLQSDQIDNEKLKAAFLETQNRIHAMSTAHETLHQSGNLASVDLAEYLRKLSETTFQTYRIDKGTIQFNAEIQSIPIELERSYPLGLAINELLSNSLKYAFPEGRSGEISISGKIDEDLVTLVVADTGVGFPSDLDWRNSESLGLQIVCSLIEDQLGGTISLDTSAGTKWTITFPV